MTVELKYIIESLLFVADGPLPLERLKAVIGTAETAALRQAIAALKQDYDTRGGGFFLEEVAGGFQLRSRPEFTEHIRRLVRPTPVRLSKAALETLAIIAYKQPAIRTDVELIRGVDCGGVMRMLLERRMIRVLGRKEMPGRPLLYGTTRQFLEVFGLKDLKELPTPKEIEAFGRTLTDSDGPLFDLEAPGEGIDAETGGRGDAEQRADAGEGQDAGTGGRGDAQTDTQSGAPLEGRAPARPREPEPDEGMDAGTGGHGDAQTDTQSGAPLEGRAPARPREPELDEGLDAAQRADAGTGGHGDAQTDTQSGAPLEGRAPARPQEPEPDEGLDAAQRADAGSRGHGDAEEEGLKGGDE